MKSVRKNFNKNVKMNIACANDGKRPAMFCIHFINGFAYATNGILLVKNLISEISSFSEEEIEVLNGKSIHKDFYRDLLKYDDVLISEDGIECYKGDDKVFFCFTVFESGQIPNFERVLQDVLNLQSIPLPQICFDTNLINKLSKSLSCSKPCKVTFKGVDKAMVVESTDSTSRNIGILMPALIKE